MLNATILRRQEVADGLVIFEIGCDFPIPDFLPGQYVAVGLFPDAPRPPGFPTDSETLKPGKLIRRSYSIASPPQEKRHVEIYVAILREGVLTPRFMLLDAGDRLHVARKITGTFTLEGVPPEAELIFVATGTGIAPFMSMLRDPGSWEGRRKITLIHGVRRISDFAYREELETLAANDKRFVYLQTVSRADPAWSGARGYVQGYFSRGQIEPAPGRDHVFLCGNPGMIEELETLLTGRGFKAHVRREPGNLHLEKYW